MLYQKVNEMEQENVRLKERIRYLEETLRENPSDKPYHCKHCTHFVQYYIRTCGTYHAVYDGSCSIGRRIKKTKPDGECCDYFEARKYVDGKL